MVNKKLIGFSMLLVAIMLVGGVMAIELEQSASEILTQNVQVSLDKQTKITTYTFNSTDSSLRIGKNDYWNIQPQTNNTQAYIKAYPNGTIKEAKFYTNDNGGVYVFGNNKVTVPPNSGVLYKDGHLLIQAPKNSELKDFPTKKDGKISSNDVITYSGQYKDKNLKLPGGAILQDGDLNWKNGQFYISKDEPVKISGVEISQRLSPDSTELKDINLFFSDQQEEVPGVYICPNNRLFQFKMISSSGMMVDAPDTTVRFTEGNPFIEVKNDGNFIIQNEHGKDGFIELRKSNQEGVPPLFTIQDVSLTDGGNVIHEVIYPPQQIKRFFQLGLIDMNSIYVYPKLYWQGDGPGQPYGRLGNIQKSVSPIRVKSARSEIGEVTVGGDGYNNPLSTPKNPGATYDTDSARADIALARIIYLTPKK